MLESLVQSRYTGWIVPQKDSCQRTYQQAYGHDKAVKIILNSGCGAFLQPVSADFVVACPHTQ